MTKELAKTLTTALVRFIDKQRPEGSMCCSNAECEAIEQAFIADNFFYVETLIKKKLSRLTEFEKVIKDRLWRTIEYSETFRKDENKYVQELAAELLDFAREQFIKDGYIIEKKAFHDAVEKVDPKVMKEVSDNVDKANEEELTEFEQEVSDMVEYCKEHGEHVAFDYAKRHARTLLALAKKELRSEKMLIEQTYNPDISKAHELGREEGIMFGKAEALKNLPRWKKDKSFETEGTFMGIKGRGYFVVKDGYSISVAELIKKLPGFKEDEQ